jgi:hypothetical protein
VAFHRRLQPVATVFVELMKAVLFAFERGRPRRITQSRSLAWLRN